ncbi:MAG: FixH family protein [Allosphingosinicella sp.]|uniref:FixH family protein n=1 Tax=Allosphingosinicella sp. TaxID=2823234 RepID=UPI00392505AB
MTRRFTGYHMWAVMIAFFGTIIAVNAVMATFATRTFGGKVVENSYVASQNFNAWLAAARAQEGLGWTVAARRDAGGRVTVELAGAEGAVVHALAQHPVGRAPDVALRFTPLGGGRYVSQAPLPAGRWNLHLLVRRGADEARFIESIG